MRLYLLLLGFISCAIVVFFAYDKIFAQEMKQLYLVRSELGEWYGTDYIFLEGSSCIKMSKDERILCGTFSILPLDPTNTRVLESKERVFDSGDRVPVPYKTNAVVNEIL